MKRSKYNYLTSIDGQYCVFNTFSGSILELEEKEYFILKDNSIDLRALSNESYGTAKKEGLIIDNSVNELDIVTFDKRYYSITAAPYFRVLTTTACNVRCPYCYEHGIDPKVMSEKDALDVADFIIDKLDEKNDFRLEWFGGEPLLNCKAIDIISEKLFRNNCIPSRITMVTNGLLVNERIADCMKNKWKINTVQITLDGTEQKYNEIKKGSSIRNPFKTVIDNIQLLVDTEIEVAIRMNVNNNEENLVDLINYLDLRFGKNEYLSYYCYPIFQNAKVVSKEVLAPVMKLNHKLIKSGMMEVKNLYGLRYHHCSCYATCFDGYTIAPDGNLYNCTHNMSSEAYVGHINNYNPYHHNRLAFVNYELSEECKNCISLPLCQGGCRAGEMQCAEISQCYLYKNALDDIIKLYLEEKEVKQ